MVDILPSFQMSDPYVSREMRVRDLLVHRSGLALGAGDLMLFPDGDLKASDLFHRLRYVPLSTSLRSKYAYDNILYVVAGAVIEQVSGKPWGEFVRTRIFEPLGMTRTHAHFSEIPEGDDLAFPHAPENGKVRVVDHTLLDADAPAGAIQSSVEDMLKWVSAQLKEGEYPSGRLLFGPSIARDVDPSYLHSDPGGWPQGTGRVEAELPGIRARVGDLRLSRTQDRPSHRWTERHGDPSDPGSGHATRGGGIDQSAGRRRIPDRDDDHSRSLFECAFDGLGGGLRSGPETPTRRGAEDRGKSGFGASYRRRPSLPLARYAGRYRDPWDGDVVVEEKNGGLWMRFTHSAALAGPLEHFQFDTFIAKWTDRSLDADAYVTFSLNANGSIERVKMKAVSPLTDFSYDFHDLALTPAPKDAPAYN